MKDNLPLGVDFAALNTLKLVYELRSFTATSQRLDVNQSAVSYTIDKLRKAFDDPLFFRQGGQVIPTERCHQIAQEAARMLDAFSDMVSPDSFVSENAEATFTIACNYYERHVILPNVIRTLRQASKGIRLKLLNATLNGPGLLKSGEADLLIGPLRPQEGEFFCRTLLTDHYVCVMDPANPLGNRPVTLARYSACDHVTVTYGAEWQSQYLLDLARAGTKLHEALSVPSPDGLCLIIPGTDLVSTVPNRIARSFGDVLKITESPQKSEFEFHMVWTTRTHHSAKHLWLREQIHESVREMLREELSS